MRDHVVIGIDLAAKSKNSTGIVVMQEKSVRAFIVHTNSDILKIVEKNKPRLIIVDAPLSPSITGTLRKADKEMIKIGYKVFPLHLNWMKLLRQRAIKLNHKLIHCGYKTIETHPTSARKVLSIPAKDWQKIQTIFKAIGLKGDVENRKMRSHEVDATTAALVGYLYLEGLTESIGNTGEGYIIIPRKQCWRRLRI